MSEPNRRAGADPLSGFVPRAVVAVLAIGIAVLLRIPLEASLEGRNMFVLLEPAIAVAAWYGGRVSGFTATVAAILAALVFYIKPTGGLPGSADTLALALFSINGVLLTLLSSGLRGAYQRERGARRVAEASAHRNDDLQRLSLALNRPMSPSSLAQTSIEQSVRLLGASGGIIATGRATDARLIIRAAFGYTGGVTGGEASNEPDSMLGQVVASGEPVILRGRNERASRYPDLADRFRSDGDSIVIPLLYEDNSTGAIYLNFDGRTGYGNADRDFLRSIGAQCGSALERSLLIERAASMAVQQQAHAAELDTILESIGDAVLVANSQGAITIANAAAARLLGGVPRRIDELPAAAEDAPAQASGPNRYLARSAVRPDRWLELARFRVKADVESSEVVLVRDVTLSVEADLQREAFLGVLSHELRTPVTSILLAVDLMRHLDGRDWDRALNLLADVDAELNRLYVIVEDLMVLTRSERGVLELLSEPVLVHRLLRDVVRRVNLTDPDVRVEFTAAANIPPVEAEPTYVQQIARNLISNAIKYGGGTEPIEVQVSARAGKVETRVLDRGVGFGPDEAEKLFTLFYRNPKAAGIAPGAGIGLYVCRLLAEAMHGTMWARPRRGGGSEFGFSLPVVREAASPRNHAPERRKAVEGATALQ